MERFRPVSAMQATTSTSGAELGETADESAAMSTGYSTLAGRVPPQDCLHALFKPRGALAKTTPIGAVARIDA